MPGEARLTAVESGLAPTTPGWFCVHARDVAWLTNDDFGGVCIFESDDFVLDGRPDLEEQTFAQLGFTLRVLMPGKPNGMYHAETDEEDFLVLSGECLLLIEDQERHLRAWDFVHCPRATGHIFVGAGEGPCVLLAAGGRTEGSRTVYAPSEVAQRHGASVETEAHSGREAYATSAKWSLGRPPRWNELPWAE